LKELRGTHNLARMSDFLRHECGLALVRLRQPLSWYRDRHGDAAWGLRRLYLLMEKQHNRGQDGAGLAVVKFDMPPGGAFLLRTRSGRHNALERVFDVVTESLNRLNGHGLSVGTDLDLKRRAEFLGEVYLGHLRYGTYAGNELSNSHPYIRRNSTASRSLAIAGNFNLTNSREIFNQLAEYGLNLVGDSDTQVILERIAYEIDREHDHLRATMGPESFRQLVGKDLAHEVSRELNLTRILQKASAGWDGGYVFGGLVGNGDAFVCRDPNGIRPCFVYVDDEVVAAASERAALCNVFDVEPDRVESLEPGSILSIKRNGEVRRELFTAALELRQCTFERIYFSRGNDRDIYAERKSLGRHLAPRVLELIDHDLEHTVFSFIPNTAESAFVGLIEEIERLARENAVLELARCVQRGGDLNAALARLAGQRVRVEKIAHKDQRLRTFITHDAARRDLVTHIYDVTRGVVAPGDTLVVLDDSIVRGTTLRESIITMLSRLNPRRIIIVSSAPPIMYPDCYGIDMSQLGRFIAFNAAVSLLRESSEAGLLGEVENLCLAQADKPAEKMVNHVARLYEPFTLDELSRRVAQLVRPSDVPWQGSVDVLYQRVEDLQQSMPEHTGDWYFTGRYPTPGGYKVLNASYLNWRAQREHQRAYEVPEEIRRPITRPA
jgi:amidophosphoribosyltransferase